MPFTELQSSAQKVPGNLQDMVLGGSGKEAACGFAAPAASAGAAGAAGASVSLFDGVETVITLKPHRISSEVRSYAGYNCRHRSPHSSVSMQEDAVQM